jgi:hypothetical protein
MDFLCHSADMKSTLIIEAIDYWTSFGLGDDFTLRIK